MSANEALISIDVEAAVNKDHICCRIARQEVRRRWREIGPSRAFVR